MTMITALVSGNTHATNTDCRWDPALCEPISEVASPKDQGFRSERFGIPSTFEQTPNQGVKR